MNGNSTIPTDEEHDAHFADHCSLCGEVFTAFNPRFHEDDEGFDFCEECTNENSEPDNNDDE